jgi:hypothetical protein
MVQRMCFVWLTLWAGNGRDDHDQPDLAVPQRLDDEPRTMAFGRGKVSQTLSRSAPQRGVMELPRFRGRLGASGEIEALGTGSSPLGVFPDATWKPHSIEIEAGDFLLLYRTG